MKKRKKISAMESFKKTVKKPYKTPQLIIHGSLEKITGFPKGTGNSDGSGRKSL